MCYSLKVLPEKIIRPTVVVDLKKVKENILSIINKATHSNTSVRLHCKTHQSKEISNLIMNIGITKITVSSVEMAEQFAEYGWKDICIAFPVNILEIDAINALASRVKLYLIVDHSDVVTFLDQNLSHDIQVWIDIDAGYGRTGVLVSDNREIVHLAKQIDHSEKMNLAGILTHSGETYACRGKEDILKLHQGVFETLKSVQSILKNEGLAYQLSVGDTPIASTLTHFEGIDEIRPGNLALYDMTQSFIGSCHHSQIAISLACPIVSKYRKRLELLVHAGGVHFSKDAIETETGKLYGRCMALSDGRWITPHMDVIRLCQEHGIVSVQPEQFDRFNIGDTLYIHPVHACMVMNLFKSVSQDRVVYLS
ncbi:alanine racemase [Candidatus Marinamargulisbacteria bacterium SCGC AG-343-D04]|nr:alanine racemase [Candidatus Marinamargulisbacteria bacterium SCGC AG-343-D04]